MYKLKLQKRNSQKGVLHTQSDIMPKPHQLWKKHLFTANTLCAVTVNFSLEFVCLHKADGLVMVATA